MRVSRNAIQALLITILFWVVVYLLMKWIDHPWHIALLLATIGLCGLISYFRQHGFAVTDDAKEGLVAGLVGTGCFLLYAIVGLSLFLLIERLLPDWGIFHGTDEDGEDSDRRWVIAYVFALPIAYLLIRGFIAWRKDTRHKH